jgi:EthD domain
MEEPRPFDGIAMFEVKSMEGFAAPFKDEHYVDVIEPDENNLLDKMGVGQGVVASFSGKCVTFVQDGKAILKTE